MILIEVIDRPFDRSPAARLIGQFFWTRLNTIEFPFETPGSQRKPGLEIVRIDFRMSRQPIEHAARLIEYSTFDAFRDVGRKLEYAGIGAPVAQRLEESPIAR